MIKPIGVIGGGKFGISIAKLLSDKSEVRLYSRRQEIVNKINNDHIFENIALSKSIIAKDSIKEVCDSCDVIFIVIPSIHFKNVIAEMEPYLSPQHILIHGTKGFYLTPEIEENIGEGNLANINIDDVKTMSQVILENTNVIRVGALCGPNLASEILEELPTATVIASPYDEVIKICRQYLSGPKFFVFGSYDLKGAELAGALKNVIALASGILGGIKMGKNAEAMLITKGLSEMIKISKVVGVDYQAFLGTAGIGDLIATATSPKSRNYTCGLRIAKGETVKEIIASSNESIEGLRSLKVAYQIIKTYKIGAPIISTIFRIIYGNVDIEDAINGLMKYPYTEDVDFIK